MAALTRFAVAVFLPFFGPAAAGERPARSVTSVDGLRDCDGGGFTLPGSDTCVRLGGAVRQDYAIRSGHGAGTASFAAGRHGLGLGTTTTRVTLDARTPTAMGPVRVYMSVRNRPSVDGWDR